MSFRESDSSTPTRCVSTSGRFQFPLRRSRSSPQARDAQSSRFASRARSSTATTMRASANTEREDFSTGSAPPSPPDVASRVAAPQPLSSWPACPGHRCRVASACSSRILGATLFALAYLRIFNAPNHVDSRDKPGYDGFRGAGAANGSPSSLLVVRSVEIVPADIFALESFAQPDPYASAVILGEEDGACAL